ncbi:hypothetical protein LNV23_00695 [Paucibacter sp. DJ1R-11]|uniref:hypothetical protein n=1 Tax=Paucibacter sp. DJ1R-11 TaxID=2893556 RepID=UPI0021E35D93|nr:hypothetical protein [Paucibacter sp. DJ1R-11]MCV2361962.1 hypothetical protein [Paucibacter sp. DJ1R-11]
MPVETSIQQAEALQRLYVKAVLDHSGLNAGSSAALISLSALALLKGVTHPNSRDLAAMGVLGSGLYAYSTTMTSKPRQLAYLAGVETLNCAVAASRPYVLPPGFLTSLTPLSEPDNSLAGRIVAAEMQSRNLSGLIEQLTARNVTRVITEPERKSTCPSPTPPLPAKPAGTDPDRLRAYNDRLAQRTRELAACAGRDATTLERRPSPDIGHMIGQLQAQRRHLHALIAQAQKQVVVFGNAGNALRQVTVDTQLSVAREVLKTEPDAAAVLKAAQAMRGTAFTLSAAPAFKPAAPASAASAAAEAYAAGPGSRSPKVRAHVYDDPPVDLLKKAREAIEAALETGDQITGQLESLNQRLRLTRTPLERCGQSSAGAVLTLSPDVSELELAPGASQNFNVSGGTGSSQAKAVEGLTRNLDGSFTFKMPANTEPGSTITLTFTDGGGKLTREVSVKAVTATASTAADATVDAGKVPLVVMAAALGLKTLPPSAQAVSKALKACLSGSKFKIDNVDLEQVPSAAFVKVMNGACSEGA